jgi:hypothetical protein
LALGLTGYQRAGCSEGTSEEVNRKQHEERTIMDLERRTLQRSGSVGLRLDGVPFTFECHPLLAPFPLTLASNGPLVASGALTITEYLEQHSMRFASDGTTWWLIGGRLAWHYWDQSRRVRIAVEIGVMDDVAQCREDDRTTYAAFLARVGSSDASRVTMNKRAHRQAGQVCPVCVAYATQKIRPIEKPLIAADGQGWKAIKARGQGGLVVCRRCGFRLHLTADEYARFCAKRLRIADIVAARTSFPNHGSLDDLPPMEIRPCEECRQKGRRGIVLERLHAGGPIQIECSHCPEEMRHELAHIVWPFELPPTDEPV